MYKLSILTPTLSSKEVMLNHYHNFKKYSSPNIELIVVDQGEFIDETVSSLSISDSSFIYIHSPRKGLSINRNLGLSYVRSEYVIFFDDDSSFYNNSLDILLKHLHHESFNFYSLCIVDFSGVNTSYTKGTNKELVSFRNIEDKVNSNGLVVSKKILDRIKFDELMGVGAFYGSCEEVDFVVKMLENNFRGLYLPSCKVVHPPKPYDDYKSYNYGLGHGYLTYKLLFLYTSWGSKYFAFKKINKAIFKLMIGFFFGRKYSNHYKSALGFFSSFKIIIFGVKK